MKQTTERTIAGFMRAAIVIILILCQVLLIIFLVDRLRSTAVIIYALIEVVAMVEIMVMVSRNRNSAYTTAWVLVISLLPVFGYVLYAMWGRSDTGGPRNDRIRASIARGNSYLERSEAVEDALTHSYPDRLRITRYLDRMGFPLYGNTRCTYYPLGEEQFEAMLADMESAERFIFLQYFIVSTGKLWDRFFDVLMRKAEQGLEIRLMYDDFGSILTTPDKDLKTLRSHGVQIARFSPIHRLIGRLYINYRNHQKMTLIDGHIAYTGGTNIADEYANLYERHGHWKDTGIRLEGDAAWGMMVTFLQMWDGDLGTQTDYDAYRPQERIAAEGFFQPFADGPINNPDNPAEVMYKSLVANAREYVYLTTPYLVIDNAMMDTLCTAARSGVDVRLITPQVWDHWYVHGVTRSNYRQLLEAGVRVYEYTPGYIHAKTVLSDDDNAITGSINMDYRSFNLHYENAVWICGAPVLSDIKKDIMDTFAQCEEIKLDAWINRPWYTRLVEGTLRIFGIFM